MLFNLPPIFGLLPLIIYIILAFKKDMHPVVNVAICAIIGAIMVKQPLLGLGAVLAKSLGSFLALVGFIIMLGSGLGAVLKRTGVAENIVNILMRRIGVNTERKAIIAAMITSIIMVTLLGTLAGANAIIAPIVIPLVAAIGITPSTLAVIFQGAGQTGLFIGPFSPPMVTMMELTGLSYPEVMKYAGIPISIVMWLVTYFVAMNVQKRTKGVYAYGADVAPVDESYEASPIVKRATTVFLVVLFSLIVYGVMKKGGAAYAIVVMITTAVATGLAAGLSMGSIFDAMMEGCGKLVWLFFMFVVFDPFLGFVEQSGAFQALVDIMKPFIQASGKTGFTLLTTVVGIFGINGAAVAQAMLIDKLFAGFLPALNISMKLWVGVILVGHQVTSFAYPGVDMVGAMGLAHSKDMKSMLKLGYSIIPATILVMIILSLIL